MSQPPQPPYAGEPYPGQPYPGQPSQGEQHPGQTYGQPPYGQPNPDMPTSVPPQPGYPPTTAFPPSGQPDHTQPQYGQPQYGQPQYGQPQYGQPQYGQQGFVQPGFPPATPPKKSSKVLPIVLVSIAIVLVLCVGGVAAFYMIGKAKVDELNAQATDPTAPAGGTAGPTKAVATVEIVEPTTLGGRPRLTDAQFAEVAEALESSLKEVPGATDTVGALYGSVAKQNIVIVAAAEAPIPDPSRELNEAFASASGGGLKIEDISAASTGSLGGVAKCGSASASGLDMAICSWADDGSLGMIMWYFKSAAEVEAEFPKLRAEIEKKS